MDVDRRVRSPRTSRLVRVGGSRWTRGVIALLTGAALVGAASVNVARNSSFKRLARSSHELRTPLNAIPGWVYILRKSQMDAQRIPRILEIVEKNAHVQAQLIGDVLDVSRMIIGQIRLQLGPQPIPRILADAVDSVRPTAEAKGVSLFVDAIDDVPLVKADFQRLQQVF